MVFQNNLYSIFRSALKSSIYTTTFLTVFSIYLPLVSCAIEQKWQRNLLTPLFF